MTEGWTALLIRGRAPGLITSPAAPRELTRLEHTSFVTVTVQSLVCGVHLGIQMPARSVRHTVGARSDPRPHFLPRHPEPERKPGGNWEVDSRLDSEEKKTWFSLIGLLHLHLPSRFTLGVNQEITLHAAHTLQQTTDELSPQGNCM